MGDELDEDDPQSAPAPSFDVGTPSDDTSGWRLLSPGEERLLMAPFSRRTFISLGELVSGLFIRK